MRTVLVGDVHGCRAELDGLLDQLAFGSEDRLISVGDLVAKGPDSSGVLTTLRACAGLAVLGNHERRLLDVRAARRQGQAGPRLGPAHERLLSELSERDWQLLEALPLFIDLPEHGVRVVHAGVMPGLPMAEQDPWALLHMRSIVDGQPSDRRASPLWAELYDQTPHIVFGHNAVDGLQLCPVATGLDTGCVYGGKLSALVLDSDQAVPPIADRRDVIVQVAARERYASLK